MESEIREHGDSDPAGSVQLINLTDGETEAPFAVREADEGSASRGSGSVRLDLWTWMGNHPVVVGVATGVICFAIIAAAVSLALSSDARNTGDDPVAGAAVSGTDGGRGSFSGDSLNFTSDDPKRTGTVGAPKALNGSDASDDEWAAAAPSVGDNALDVNATTGDDSGSANDADRTGANNGNGSGDQGTNGSGATPTTSGATTSTVRTSSTVRNTVTTTRGTVTPRPTSTPATTNTAPTSPTTASTTSSSTPTTPSTPPSASNLIAAPGNYSVHPIDNSTTFAANVISGASQYCWSFNQPGVSHGPFCSAATSYQLPAGALGLAPGLVSVTATASGPSVNQSESMSIILTRSWVLAQPYDGATAKHGKTLPVRIAGVVGASEHLLRFVQDGYDSGWISYGDVNGTTLTSRHPLWDDLVTGDLTILASVQGAGRVLASGKVTVSIVD